MYSNLSKRNGLHSAVLDKVCRAQMRGFKDHLENACYFRGKRGIRFPINMITR